MREERKDKIVFWRLVEYEGREEKKKIALADWWNMREERRDKIVLWRMVEYEGGEELKNKNSPLEIGGI